VASKLVIQKNSTIAIFWDMMKGRLYDA
jgi:hypothetical protein